MSGHNSKGSTFTPTDDPVARERYRSLFERHPEAVVVTTTAGRILDFNPATLTFFAVSRDRFQDADIASYYASRTDLARLVREADETGLVNDSPVIFVDGRHGLKHARVTTMRLDDPDGQVYGYQSVIRDVTQQRMAEKKLQSQKNYAEQLIDLAPEAIGILDFENRVIRVNEEFCRLFQYAEDDCIGRRINDLIVPRHLQAESLSLSARATAANVSRWRAGG